MQAASPTVSRPPSEQRGELSPLLRGAAALLGTGAVVFGVEAGIDNPLLALVIGFFVVDIVARRLGAGFGEGGKAYRQAAIGFGLGSSLALLVAGIAELAGIATVGLGAPTLMTLLAVGRPLLMAFRDELLYRGIPLALARRARVHDGYTVVFAALLGTAPLLTAPSVRPEALLLTFTAGLFFALLFRTGLGRVAFLAHASWLFFADIGFRGALLDVSFTSGAIAPYASAKGMPAYLAAGVFGMGAVGVMGWWRRRG